MTVSLSVAQWILLSNHNHHGLYALRLSSGIYPDPSTNAFGGEQNPFCQRWSPFYGHNYEDDHSVFTHAGILSIKHTVFYIGRVFFDIYTFIGRQVVFQTWLV